MLISFTVSRYALLFSHMQIVCFLTSSSKFFKGNCQLQCYIRVHVYVAVFDHIEMLIEVYNFITFTYGIVYFTKFLTEKPEVSSIKFE